jgi:hypothetical protein
LTFGVPSPDAVLERFEAHASATVASNAQRIFVMGTPALRCGGSDPVRITASRAAASADRSRELTR